jgi:hypothetical protein
MIKGTERIPVKTRLPLSAWVMAAIVTAFSLVSSLTQGSLSSNRAEPMVAQAIVKTENLIAAVLY